MFKKSLSKFAALTAVAALVAGVTVMSTGPVDAADVKFRLSTMAQPNSDAHKFLLDFAKQAGERTGGRAAIKVYPANQLGDWDEVHELVMQGAVDMAMQSLSTKFDQGLALAWFPYTTLDYASSKKAFSSGGLIYNIVDGLIAKQDMKLLGVYGYGMGGSGFTKPPPHPRDPNARQGTKCRVWPGGTTHRVLMERFGFTTAPVPWAELYTARQTGVVDGQIGGTPELEVENFADITKMWVQYNDHFEPVWLVVNKSNFEKLSAADQKAVFDVAQELSAKRFEEMESADQKYLQVLRDKGAEVIILTDEELAKFAHIARTEVWPKIADEIGPEVMAKLKKELGIK
jgi:TRAP-type C4-dicarboxylate transport system substrate-binding protein